MTRNYSASASGTACDSFDSSRTTACKYSRAGRLDVFPPPGTELLVEALEPQGYGALQHTFEQLKTVFCT